ncbi:MAG TPA: HNH endonuclease signature motif containing protein [Patescibacteria group bacterium]|nr:HNH endonuclease signature motif containing protein [Patescibacteria group bacterium]
MSLKKIISLIGSILLIIGGILFYTSTTGCERWHACPSPLSLYTCGDLGYCSYCPDNQFCAKGLTRDGFQGTSSTRFIPNAASKNSNCLAQNGLPDPECTPGAIFTTMTMSQICQPNYSRSVRNVSDETKQLVYANYGIRSHVNGAYEIDHLIPLELGGSNEIANLWPEAANPKPGFHEKDALENELHAAVCDGSLTLPDAQKSMATRWLNGFTQ